MPFDQKAYSKQYYKRNRERLLERNRQWLLVHKDERREYRKRYRASHREQANERNKKWRARNRDKLRARWQRFKEVYSVRRRVRYWQKRDQILQKRREKYRLNRPYYKLRAILGDKCIQCGFSDPRFLQIDHIYGGGRKETERFKHLDIMCRYYLANLTEAKQKLQILCSYCNSTKPRQRRQVII